MTRPFCDLDSKTLSAVRIIAVDVDDTLTVRGRLTPVVVAALDDLASRGIEVILATGRPAGMVTALVTFLPGVRRGIAENGGVVVRPTPAAPQPMSDEVEPLRRRQQACRAEVEARLPHVRVTADLYTRLVDLTFENSTIRPGDRQVIDEIAAALRLTTLASSIHLHVCAPGLDKGSTLEALLRDDPGDVAPHEVLTLGDSDLDGPLFDPARFPLSVGVANVRSCLGSLQHRPAWVTEAEAGNGFLEVAGALLAARPITPR
ncbi:MAG: HAD hydrolase family protein [Candidatus Riflebacteria bacterium]|nr:HAD hydrolase family protein [Candidatus Riflebacteria bacterium]